MWYESFRASLSRKACGGQGGRAPCLRSIKQRVSSAGGAQESGCAAAHGAFDFAIAVARKGKIGGRYNLFCLTGNEKFPVKQKTVLRDCFCVWGPSPGVPQCEAPFPQSPQFSVKIQKIYTNRRGAVCDMPRCFCCFRQIYMPSFVQCAQSLLTGGGNSIKPHRKKVFVILNK